MLSCSVCQAREIRQKASATPIRKEKAEVEALQATIEKMKIEHEQAVKKHKLNEQRYMLPHLSCRFLRASDELCCALCLVASPD